MSSRAMWSCDVYLEWVSPAFLLPDTAPDISVAFPLFTTQMYNNLGINWASTLVAFLSLSCTPLPMYAQNIYASLTDADLSHRLFYIYGERIRVRTKFGREANEIGQAMRRTATMGSVQEKTRSYEDQTARAQPGGPAGV